MIGDVNGAYLSGTINSDVKVTEKNGKKYARFALLNKFKLSEKSKEVEGEFQVFCIVDHLVTMCEAVLQKGDRLWMSGFISQKADERSGKLYISFVPNHMIKLSESPKEKPSVQDDDLPW